MRRLLFTVVMTCISRALIARDRLSGRLRRISKRNASDSPAAPHRIPSGNNTLHAVFVQPAACPTQAALLICHGIGETVEHWHSVQQLLARNGVASLVFDYSGYGQSSGYISADQCERDAVAAFLFLGRLVPSAPLSLLGFSLGSGIAAAVISRVAAHRLVLCAAFTSLGHAAHSIGILRPFAGLVATSWNTEQVLATCAVPVLLVHGQQDELFPPRMALALAAACRSPCELILVPGLSHNAPIFQPQLACWPTIAASLSASTSSHPGS